MHQRLKNAVFNEICFVNFIFKLQFGVAVPEFDFFFKGPLHLPNIFSGIFLDFVMKKVVEEVKLRPYNEAECSDKAMSLYKMIILKLYCKQ